MTTFNWFLEYVPMTNDFALCDAETGQSIIEGSPVSENEEEGRAALRLITAAPDFFCACEGKQYPDVDAVQWAHGIIEDFGRLLRGEPLDSQDDPDAAWTAYREAKAMIDGLMAAMAKVRGKSQ